MALFEWLNKGKSHVGASRATGAKQIGTTFAGEQSAVKPGKISPNKEAAHFHLNFQKDDRL